MTESIERPIELVDGGGDAPDTHDAVIAEALSVIDQALGQMVSRELVSSGEVADLLLDLRTALTASSATPSQV